MRRFPAHFGWEGAVFALKWQNRREEYLHEEEDSVPGVDPAAVRSDDCSGERGLEGEHTLILMSLEAMATQKLIQLVWLMVSVLH